MLTSPLVMSVRAFTRKIGLNKLISLWFYGRHYEDSFGPALLSSIKSGDIVWDIGANVGIYTKALSDIVGETGLVVAFEPTPACFGELKRLFSQKKTIILKNVALGDSDGRASMLIDTDPLGVTHRLVGDAYSGSKVAEIDVRSAESLVLEFPDIFPNAVKIDVEGHEGSVLDGFDALLSDHRLQTIGIEMHFGLLEERGEPSRPREIQEMLIRNGFSVRWTDPSHLLAIRAKEGGDPA